MRGLRVVAAAAALLLVASGCSSEPASAPSPAVTSAAPTPTPPPTATPVTRPADRACYDLTYDEAVAPSTTTPAGDCAAAHTAVTFAVGDLDTVVGGHLLAVDSERVQAQVAAQCPQRLGDFVGGGADALRLTMLRSVWFTPTVEESDAGADWFRCDVIAVAADSALAPLSGRLAGVLDTPQGRDRFGMCGTAAPDADDFARVICSDDHAWRAIATVDVPGRTYPGADAARAAGQTPCEDAGRDLADDALNFRWGYEWPSAEQWAAGQTYGICWAPD